MKINKTVTCNKTYFTFKFLFSGTVYVWYISCKIPKIKRKHLFLSYIFNRIVNEWLLVGKSLCETLTFAISFIVYQFK